MEPCPSDCFDQVSSKGRKESGLFRQMYTHVARRGQSLSGRGGTTVAVNDKIRDESTDRLFEAMLLLKNVDECYAFFEDICTVSELKSIAQRLEVAKMLDQNRTYEEIVDLTGASTATISRVKRSLLYGADGYRLVLERLRENKH